MIRISGVATACPPSNSDVTSPTRFSASLVHWLDLKTAIRKETSLEYISFSPFIVFTADVLEEVLLFR